MVDILFKEEGGKTSVLYVLLPPVESVSGAKQALFSMQRPDLNSLKATVSIRKGRYVPDCDPFARYKDFSRSLY